MARRRASVATMSRPMGAQDVTKAICLVLVLNFRFLRLSISTGLPLMFCITNIMTRIIIASFSFFFFSYIYIIYISRSVFLIGDCQAAKFRFRPHDSQKTILQLRIPEVGNWKTGSYRVSWLKSKYLKLILAFTYVKHLLILRKLLK